ncbi:MAG: FHA domain-containing protein [Lentisphaeraceae bacterium]|nr:FHA domain-containing protein [Lentisphaeraceae bacterium]
MDEEQQSQSDSRTIAMSRTEVLTGMSRRRVSYLEVNSPERPRLNFKLTDGKVVMGRTTDNQITLPFTNVSRHHACVYINGEDYYVEDNGSTNGTYVNGVKIAKCILRPNDLIQIGATKIYYSEREELCL